MQLTNSQILALADAITLLDGQHRIEVIDGKPTQVFHGYKIPHKARWNLARDLGLLHVAINDFNRAKDSLLFSLSDGKGQLGPNDGEKFTQFVRDVESMFSVGYNLGEGGFRGSLGEFVMFPATSRAAIAGIKADSDAAWSVY